jgi:four helix bundle protein
MATIKSFKDLQVWKDAREFASDIFQISIDGSFARDFGLRDQINRSTGSIMDNIAEGFERDGKKEFIMFLSFSKGSAGEARSQLYRALDRKHITEEQFQKLHEQSEKISNQLGSFIQYLKQSEYKGTKFLRP